MTQQQTQIALRYTRLTERFPLGSAYYCFYNDRLYNRLFSNVHKASPLLVLMTLYSGKQNFKNNTPFSYILKRIRQVKLNKQHAWNHRGGVNHTQIITESQCVQNTHDRHTSPHETHESKLNFHLSSVLLQIA